MASSTIAVSGPGKTGTFRKIAAYSLIGLLVLVLALLAWLYSIGRSALPQLDGQLQVAGLSAPVKVVRDGHGVPTIEAADLTDLFFAQGYVTAQDRLWQMDGMRRYAAGELAEILGDEQLKHDREQRILGLRDAARKSIATASQADRTRFEAYAHGVNAFIASHGEDLPIEFRILHYSPKPWTPEDSVLIAIQMVEELNHGSFENALTREKILAKLGPDLTGDLYVNRSWHDRPPTVPRPSMEENVPGKDDDKDDEDEEDTGPENSIAALWRGEMPAGILAAAPDAHLTLGSNDWVVSGAHTVTGKPLLSNDMHLAHQMPNLWYEAHLHAGDFDVAGVTLPGMPYVIVGHNRRVAWGFTNVGPTVEDVYLETLDAAGRYLTPKGWQETQHRTEVIHVKGRPDVRLDVALTRHGPLITELVPGEARPLALRWTLYDGLQIPFFDVDSAQNWEQFRAAFSRLDAPGQNAVYADVDGNIGYQATGKVPMRASGDGSLPENGRDDGHEWTGYIPFDKLPSIFNPPSGIIATANGRITPDGYPYSISTEWEAPWRTARIYRVLESGKKIATADMLALQMDIYSEAERYTAERFVYAVDHARNPSTRAKAAAEIMRGWDGRMTAESAAPTITTRARTELTRLLLEPKLGPAPKDHAAPERTLNWKSYRWFMRSVWLENVLQHQPRRWLPDAYANYDELLATAVQNAISDAEAPGDLNAWKWGDAHPVEIQHPVLGQIPLLRYWTGPGVQPLSGSGYTVKAVTRGEGPSERMTDDLADLDQSTLNLVTGEAGNFLSPYYMDQWKAWYEGFTFTLPFSAEAVQKSRTHELVLAPK